ncbi:MAG: SEC-C domain-containing protein [Caulobacter sp.]|nr:SEC-C domain-containing protein [Caulobacter sp.]
MKGRLSCASHTIPPTSTAFEVTSKRRKGFPSETRVKRGLRMVHGDKELVEKLGRNDLCPCGSRRLFQALLPEGRRAGRRQSG